MQTEIRILSTLNRLLILFGFVLFLSASVIGQSVYPDFEHYSIEHGLSQSTATCIMQDSKGFIWIGTKDGLNRFDGYSFKIFRNIPGDSLSLSDNIVTAISEDDFGDIWIGTESGYLNRLDITTEKFSLYKIKPNPLFAENEELPDEIPPCYSFYSSNTITTLCCDKEGYVWIGTWGKGIFKFDAVKNEFTNHFFKSDEENSIASNYILSLVQEKSGAIWIGTFGSGLDKLIFKTNPKPHSPALLFKNYSFHNRIKNCISHNKVTSLCLNKSEENKLFIGTFGGGINILESIKNSDSVKFSVINYTYDRTKKITQICFDQNGFLWAGTFGDGLIKYDSTYKLGTVLRNEVLNNSINDNDVISLAVDKTGLIWIGTLSGYGINKLNPYKIKIPYYGSNPFVKNGLSDNVVLSFAEDKDSNIWIGTYKGGLNKFDRKNKSFTSYKFELNKKDCISSNYITSICCDNEGNIWIGSYDNGLNLLKRGSSKFIHFIYNKKNINSIGNNRITSIVKDNFGTIWVGTFGDGLNKVVKNEYGEISFIHYRNNQLFNSTITDNRIDKLYIDNEGVVWVATYNGYLSKYDKQKDEFVNYKVPSDFSSSISPTRIASIYESLTGKLWLGTFGKGLMSFNKNNNSFSVLYKTPDFASKNIYGVLGDNKDNLWISSDNGLCKFNTADNTLINFGLSDGLQSMQYNAGAAFKAKNGEMFFGGINGFNSFVPDKLYLNTIAPVVNLISIKTLNKIISYEKYPVELSHYNNSINFEFAVMDYSNPLQNQFAYKLAGFDENWNYSTGIHNSVTYSNLSPGEYLFILKGSNSSGSWSKNEIQFRFIILKPYWHTWWFFLVIILTVAGLVIYFFVLRLQKIFTVEKIKTKLSADLHDEIGSGLTEISLLSEIAERQLFNDAKGVKEKLKVINEKADELIGKMSDIVWLVNPKQVTLYELILRLRDIYLPICEPLMINFRINNLEELENLKITMEQRQNIYLIFKEAINNSLKYSGCKNITLIIEKDDKVLELCLIDDGNGFDFKTTFSGNGLKNMKSRAEALKYKFEIQSTSGLGTKVILSMNIGKF